MAKMFAAKRRGPVWRAQIMPLLLFVLVAVLFWWGMGNLGSGSSEERLNIVQRAVTKAVVHCYALEGQYPASVAYLREHYGLRVDEERYIVDLTFIGGNIMPQVIVLDRYFGEEG